MDARALLALQIDWGADEALEDAPVHRLRQPSARATPAGATPSVLSSPPSLITSPGMAPAPLLAHSLDTLKDAIRADTTCALRETATNPVFAAGNPAGGLLFIGDPPGDAEDRSGQPFAGQNGDILDLALWSIGLRREDVLVAPLIPWRPPGNRQPTDAELAQCLPYLHRLIVLAAPHRLVLFGALAARALLPASQNVTLRRVRGRWTDITVPGLDRPLPALPMHSPTVLRTPAARREAWADWRMLHRSKNQEEKIPS